MKTAISGNIITYTFEGDVPALVFDTTKVSIEVKHYAAMDRLKDRVKDAAAIPKSADNQYTVTEAMRREAMLPLVEHYESGATTWNRNGPKAAPQSPVILAIAAKFGISYEAAMAKVAEQFLAEIAE